MKATTPHRGGETVALEMLGDMGREYMSTFEKPKTAPTALKASTTLLSPHMHFGSLGVREFYWRVADLKPKSQPPASLIGQLLFREVSRI